MKDERFKRLKELIPFAQRLKVLYVEDNEQARE
jgi:hypothetical protein